MAKFKIGDRVKVKADYDVEIDKDIYPNSTGTVTDNSFVPDVMWDSVNMFHQSIRDYHFLDHERHFCEEDLELISEVKPINIPQMNGLTLNGITYVLTPAESKECQGCALMGKLCDGLCETFSGLLTTNDNYIFKELKMEENTKLNGI